MCDLVGLRLEGKKKKTYRNFGAAISGSFRNTLLQRRRPPGRKAFRLQVPSGAKLAVPVALGLEDQGVGESRTSSPRAVRSIPNPGME